MKFWTTGRIDEKITFESFQPAMLKVEKEINNVIKSQDYGDLITSYDVIVNIFEKKIEEKFRYSLKNRETDIDVSINHDDFLNSNTETKYKLYLKAVLYSIEKMKLNKHLKDFNFELFQKTIAPLLELE